MIPRSFFARAALLLCALGPVGCHPPVKSGTVDKWLAVAVQDAAVRNGILAQQTVYPYHFVEDSGELNALGMTDLRVLADHYRLYPGELGVRRGGARAEVYEARLRAVRDALADGGVDTSRMKLGDFLQGGEGMASERVIRVLEASYEKSQGSGDRERRPSGSSAGESRGASGGSSSSGGSQRTGGR